VTRVAWRLATMALAAGVVAGCALVRGPDDVDRALRARRLMVPMAGVEPDQVPDTFDERRDGGGRRHGALDIPAPRGTLVVSADDGTVLAVRSSRLGGRTLYAPDPDRRFVYYYAHLDRHRPGLRQGTALARMQVASKPAIVKSLDVLERRRLVRRRRSSADRRLVDVELTAAGRTLVRRVQREVHRREHRLTGRLTVAEKRLLARLLRKLDTSLTEDGRTS